MRQTNFVTHSGWTVLGALCVAASLAGCGTTDKPQWEKIEPESFTTQTSHARRFPASLAKTCEAGRRALLGQGYLIETDSAERGMQQVVARKFFQPKPEIHAPVEMRLVCMPEAEHVSVMYAVAVQEVHMARKSKQSASVGVGGVGSVSLPVESGSDGMVKVGTQTISDHRFYDSFFATVEANVDLR